MSQHLLASLVSPSVKCQFLGSLRPIVLTPDHELRRRSVLLSELSSANGLVLRCLGETPGGFLVLYIDVLLQVARLASLHEIIAATCIRTYIAALVARVVGISTELKVRAASGLPAAVFTQGRGLLVLLLVGRSHTGRGFHLHLGRRMG